MLRLDPAHPPLWRTPTTLQFGATAVATIHDPEPWQERLLRELERGVPEAALEAVAVAFGAPDDAAAEFVRNIRRALAARGDDAPRRVTLQAADDVDPTHVASVAAALTACDFEVVTERWHGAPGEAAEGPAPIVVLANHLIEPRRAAALIAHDIAHLPVVLTGDTVEIGPFVAPGRTPCLACIAAHRRDADPAWPLLAAQLLGRPVLMQDAGLVKDAGIAVGRMLSAAMRRAPAGSSRSLTLRADALHRQARVHRPHPECRCRSLVRSASAADPVDLAPTSPAAFAVPA